jgi:dTDP-4-dehydrorhamnose reductase
MKIAITGAGGQLGQDLIRVLSVSHEVVSLSRSELDVTEWDAVRSLLVRTKPDAVIHAAAYTNVDGAEHDPDGAYLVNANGSWHVAAAAADIGTKLVYVSTDYVFDGRKRTPYNENDRPHPLNVYGASKLLGERYVQKVCERHFIVRTSWLYGRTGAGFVTKVADKARRVRSLSLVCDQIGSPTYTLDLAEWIGKLVTGEKYGIYHAANSGCCSRYEFGLEIVRALGLERDVQVTKVSSAEFPTPAVRPAYSALDDWTARARGLPRMRDWRSALQAFFRNDYGKGIVSRD